MGLDVYVGSLARYYSRQWETIIQQAARQRGEKVQLVYYNRPPDAPPGSGPERPSWEEAAEATKGWREYLNEQLQLASPLAWDESEAAPYFTDKPGWDCYLALLLWAAYNDNPRLARPTVLPEAPSDDPALGASRKRGSSSRYPHLLLDVELWLPAELGSPFQTPDPGSTDMVVGSSTQLLQHLENLNARTWRAEPKMVEGWATDCPDHGAPLTGMAQFAFAVMLTLTKKAVEHCLPMRLDY